MQVTVSETFARWAAVTDFADLPPGLVEEQRILVLDALAAAAVGSVQPWSRSAVELVFALGGAPKATVFGRSRRIDASRAAFANGALIGGFESEPLTGSHAAATVLPAVLAVAETEGRDGQSLLTALTVGAELSARLASAAVGLEQERGFHNPGVHGPLAAALASGWLYRLTEAQLVHAIGLAASSASGLLEFATDGSDTKRFHPGRASQLGLEAALLARGGRTGPATAIEGRYGVMHAFSMPGVDVDGLTAGLGEQWRIRPPLHKAFPTHATHQAVIAAIAGFRHEHQLAPEELTRIAVTAPGRALEPRHLDRAPRTVLGAQYSLPFAVAVALTRVLSDPLAFDDTAVADPLVRDLASRVEVRKAEDGVGTVELEFGPSRYQLATPPHLGSPRNPLSWLDAAEKFRRYTRGVIEEQDVVEAVIASVGALDRASNLDGLMALLRPSDRRTKARLS